MSIETSPPATQPEHERPQAGAVSSSELWRINSTAHKINEAFDKARAEARDEALWLASMCQMLLRDNDRLRIENERLRKGQAA